MIIPFVIRVAAALCQGAVIFLVARHMSVADFGVYSSISSLGAIVFGIVGGGLPSYALHVNNRKTEERELVAQVSIVLAIIGAGILAVSSAILFPVTSCALLGAAVAYSVVEFRGGVFQASLYSELRGVRADVSLLIRRLVPLMLLFLLPRLFALSADIVLLFSYSIILISMLARLPPIKSLHLLVELRERCHRFWLIGLWSMLQQVDILIISKILGAESAGVYSAAFRIASPVHIVTTLIISRLIPLATAEKTLDGGVKIVKMYRRGANFYGALVILCSPAAAFVGPMLVGEKYAPHGFVFSLLMMSSGFSVLNQVSSAMLLAKGIGSGAEKIVRFYLVVGLILVFLCSISGFDLAAFSIAPLIQFAQWCAFRKLERTHEYKLMEFR